MKVLYIGGTGEISPGCIAAGLESGQDISVYNRGNTLETLPRGAKHIAGDLSDQAKYLSLGQQRWDVVCQFRSFDLAQCERDIGAFSGNVGQFVFISTAMVYQRPPAPFVVKEDFPQGNAYSDYATRKMAIEKKLMEVHCAGKMPVTIVRPSHTMRARFPSAFISDDHMVWRLLRNKPIISHGDGSSLWTVTRCEDFGRAFARLPGNPKTLGEAYHITSDEAHPWDAFYRAAVAEMGAKPQFVHVASETLVRYDPSWAGALLGDKSHSVMFDNSKVKKAVGGWECRHGLADIIRLAAPHVRSRQEKFSPDPKVDALLDRIIEEQSRLGA